MAEAGAIGEAHRLDGGVGGVHCLRDGHPFFAFSEFEDQRAAIAALLNNQGCRRDPGAEFDDIIERLPAVIDVEHAVLSKAKRKLIGVATYPTLQLVVADPAIQGVCPAAAVERVIASPTQEDVVGVAAVAGVVAVGRL